MRWRHACALCSQHRRSPGRSGHGLKARRRAPADFLCTDFGSGDLYAGQVKAVVYRDAPGSTVINLLNDAPSFDIVASAHLLAALALRLPADAGTLAVVDPGVGTARAPVALQADGRWYVGPDNGLMSVVAARAAAARCFALTAMTQSESVSFHGRDLFAPVVAAIARGAWQPSVFEGKPGLDIEVEPRDLPQIIYVDRRSLLVREQHRFDRDCG